MIERALTVAVIALSGCYSPALRDCTVSCASPDDCAAGQICGGAGLCVAHDLAAPCGASSVDAGPRGDAAVMRDAPSGDAASPDLVPLDVQVTGKGSVVVDGKGTCSSEDPQRGNCTYRVAPGVALVVHAVGIQFNQVFAAWSSTTCSGAGATCSFTPTAATTLAARFARP